MLCGNVESVKDSDTCKALANILMALELRLKCKRLARELHRACKVIAECNKDSIVACVTLTGYRCYWL
jgi:hypothetical protein